MIKLFESVFLLALLGVTSSCNFLLFSMTSASQTSALSVSVCVLRGSRTCLLCSWPADLLIKWNHESTPQPDRLCSSPPTRYIITLLSSGTMRIRPKVNNVTTQHQKSFETFLDMNSRKTKWLHNWIQNLSRGCLSFIHWHQLRSQKALLTSWPGSSACLAQCFHPEIFELILFFEVAPAACC